MLPSCGTADGRISAICTFMTVAASAKLNAMGL
jgi:hypothetical protein